MEENIGNNKGEYKMGKVEKWYIRKVIKKLKKNIKENEELIEDIMKTAEKGEVKIDKRLEKLRNDTLNALYGTTDSKGNKISGLNDTFEVLDVDEKTGETIEISREVASKYDIVKLTELFKENVEEMEKYI